MSKKTAKKPGRICDPAKGSLVTYEAIKGDYKTIYGSGARKERNFYLSQPSFDAAIKAAAAAMTFENKKHDHQWRIPKRVLASFGMRLLKIRADLESAANFHELWIAVRDQGRQVKGIGELTIYDTAHRIGLNRGLEPEYIYLHAGTRKGARALGLPAEQDFLLLDQIPIELRELKPHEIEDCLCIYKGNLAIAQSR